ADPCRGRPRRDRGRGAHQRSDRCRDGGDDSVLGGRTDGLRHGQGARARGSDRGRAADREDGRQRGLARAAVVTVSTRVSRGEAEDESGPALASLCEQAGLEVVAEVVSDDREAIATALRRLADQENVRFIFTTGGTGMTTD